MPTRAVQIPATCGATADPRDRRSLAHRRTRLRWRHHRDDRRDPAEHRGRARGAIRGLPRSGSTIRSCAGERRRVPARTSTGRAAGELGPFILVVEGSIPDETNKAEGYWAAFGTDPTTGQPITTCEWIDRLAPKAWAVVAAGTCAAYGGIHAMEGNPTGCMGLPDYLGWEWKSRAGIPIVCVPGCPVAARQHDGDVALSASQAAGRAPMIPLDEALRPTMAVRPDGARRLRSRRLLRAGGVRRRNTARRSASSSLAAGGRSCSATWASGAGWAASAGCPNVGGICIGCTMPGFPDKFMPFMDQPPGSLLSSARGDDLRPRDPGAAPIHAGVAEQGAGLAGHAPHPRE